MFELLRTAPLTLWHRLHRALLRVAVWALALAVGLVPFSAQPELLNATSAHPSFTWFTGALHFDASSGLFEYVGSSKWLMLEEGMPARRVSDIPGVGKSNTLGMHLDSLGNFVSGIPGDDFVVTGSLDLDKDGVPDYEGTLLTAEVLAFGWRDGAGTDTFELLLQVTGGLVAFLFDEDAHHELLFANGSSFDGNFEEDFSADPVSGKACLGQLCGDGVMDPGEDCDDGNNDQEGKATCSGDAADTHGVSLVITKDGSKFDVDPTRGLNPGDLVMISLGNGGTPSAKAAKGKKGGGKFPTELGLDIVDGPDTLQKLEIHTSCSKSLEPGDIFGALELIGFNSAASNSEIVYDYVISNDSAIDLVSVTAVDDKLGPLTVNPFSLGAGQSILLNASAAITENTINTVEVNAETASGAMCSADATAKVLVAEPPEPGRSCADGKAVLLEFKYTGGACENGNNSQEGKHTCSGDPGATSPVEIVITKDANKTQVSKASVAFGETFEISMSDGKKMKAETIFEIRQGSQVLQSLNIHPSCSKSIAEGDQFGSVLLERFVPED
ncbi:MAG: DUF4215 domain-containing protein [bacterium]|nr:DUF4215 domain-containing protein [bacterium]